MEDGRVSHSWCTGVVSHGYGGLGQGWRWLMVCMLEKAKVVGHRSEDAGALPERKVIH